MTNPIPRMSDQTAKDIGEIKGLLQGVTQMIIANNDALNRRIDDMTRAVTQRLDATDSRLSRVELTAAGAFSLGETNKTALEGMQRQAAKTATGVGAGAGALVAAGAEIIKAVLNT